jgi:hypothetical protein
MDEVLGAAVGGVDTDPFCCNPSDLRRSAGGLPGGVVDSSIASAKMIR